MHIHDSQSRPARHLPGTAPMLRQSVAGLPRQSGWRNMVRGTLIVVGLLTPARFSGTLQAAPEGLPAERQTIVEALQQRALLTLDRQESRVWLSLAEYAVEDLARAKPDGPWPLIAHASTRVVHPGDDSPLRMTVTVGQAVAEAYPVETTMQLALVVLDSKEVFLFAEPAVPGEPLQIYQHHLEQQSQRYPRGQDAARAIRSIGGARWARALMRIAPAPGRAAMSGERVTVQINGEPQLVALPSRAELEARIGVPLDDAIRRAKRSLPKSVIRPQTGNSRGGDPDRTDAVQRSLTSTEEHLLQQFQRKALLEVDPEQAVWWRRLARFARADLQDARDPVAARKFWESATASTTRLLPLTTRDILEAGAAEPDLNPFPMRFAFCLVQTAEQALLFGAPDLGVEPAAEIYATHRHQVAALTVPVEQRNALERRIIAAGPVRWAMLLAPLRLQETDSLNADLPLPRRNELERLIGKRSHLPTGSTPRPRAQLSPDPLQQPLTLETLQNGGPATGGQVRRDGRPAMESLTSGNAPPGRSRGSEVAVRNSLPPDPFEETPARETILVAVDWSTFVVDRKPWLLEELRSLLADIPEEALVGNGVHLQSAARSAVWSRKAIRDGQWPSELPPPHESDAAGSLGGLLQTARQRKGLERTVLVVWNSTGFPETRTEFDRRLRALLGDVPTGRVARSVGLSILQVHGRRLDFLEDLAGEASYQIFRYRPNGPAVLHLGRPSGR